MKTKKDIAHGVIPPLHNRCSIGVERTFLIHSPNVVKIDVTRAFKVRRANLGFLRKLSGKALRLPEVELKLTYKEFAKPEVKAETSEVVPEVAEAAE